jgi:pimeloyl-ACP methyl ester carboxylesterase
MMASLDRDGFPIYYEVTGGESAGLPVLLSHGFTASTRMWQPNIAALSAGRPVITWDLRGHGRSGAPDDPARYSQEASLGDMAGVLDACGIQRVVAGGLSLGGYLSLAFYQACPDRVAALVLCDTGPGYRNDEARQRWNDRALAQAARLERDGLAALAGPETRAAGHRSAVGLAHAARGILTQRDGTVMASLPSITVPTLVLVGARDQPFLGAAEYMAAKIPGATLAVIPGAGHASNIDQPELFNEQVLAFLQQPALRCGSLPAEEGCRD